MGSKVSKLFGRNRRPKPSAAASRALQMPTTATPAATAAPSVQAGRCPPQTAPAKPSISNVNGVSLELPASAGSLYVVPPPTTTIDTALSEVRELLEATRGASDIFTSLSPALVSFLEVWKVYARTPELHGDFVELASGMAGLSTFVARYKGPGEDNLQERLDAIALAVDLLTDAMQARQSTENIIRFSREMGGAAVVKIMVRRVVSVLEAFKFKIQIRVDNYLAMILERLKAPQQRVVTSVDAIKVIIEHMDKQYSSTLERRQAIIEEIERGKSEWVINNNSNRNETDGQFDVENNNANETELEIEGRGGGIANNNSNVNRVVRDDAVSPGSTSSGGERSPLPQIRVTNNNGNKNIVRRTAGMQRE